MNNQVAACAVRAEGLPPFAYAVVMRWWLWIIVWVLCILPRGVADEARARRYQDAACSVVMCADAQLRRFVLSTQRPNELRLWEDGEEQVLRVGAVEYITQVLPCSDERLLVAGIDGAGRTRLLMYAAGAAPVDATPADLPAWCMPIMEVARGGKRMLLLQAAPEPCTEAPFYVLDAATGELCEAGIAPAVSHALLPDGSVAAWLQWAEDGSKSIYASVEGGADRCVLTVAPDVRLQLAGNAGPGVVYVLHDREREGTCLAVLRLSDGRLQPLAEAGRADVMSPFFSHSGEIVGYTRQWDKMTYVPLRTCAVMSELQRSLPADAEWVPLRLSADEQRVQLQLMPAGQPERPAVYELGKGLRELSVPQQVPPTRPTRFAEYTAADGTRIPCYYTLPQGAGPFPTVIFVHGGPRMRNDGNYDWRVQYLVSCGFAVVQPQFRGSRGWGKSFMHAGNRQWGKGVMQTDVNDCIPWLVEQGIAERGRIAVFGGSYGGYAVTASLCFYPGMYACGVSLFGPQDLLLYLQKMNGVEQAYAGEDALTVGDVRDPAERARLQAVSPACHVENFRDPLLVYYGERDTLIPPEHSRLLIRRMQAAGKDVTVVSLPDEAHGFANPAHEPWLYARLIVPFFNKHLNHHE